MTRFFVGRRLGGLAALAATGFLAAAAHATPVTLTNGNSSATFDPASTAFESTWDVDGVNQVSETCLWGSTAAGSEATLTNVFSTGGILSATYTGDGYNMIVGVDLVGGSAGSKTSAMTETLTFNNTSDSSMNLKLFEYEAFAINGSPNNNTLTLSGTPVNTAVQSDTLGDSVTIDATGGGTAPDAFQIGTGGTILSLISETPPGDLNDNSTGPLFGDNVNFAFEWDPTLAAGGSFQISVNKVIQGGAVVVPLPNAASGGAVLLGLLTGIGLLRKAIRKLA